MPTTQKNMYTQKGKDFPAGPAVNILPSNARVWVFITGWEAKIPRASWPKDHNIKKKNPILVKTSKERIANSVYLNPFKWGLLHLIYTLLFRIYHNTKRKGKYSHLILP